jgi:hypothetical protein
MRLDPPNAQCRRLHPLKLGGRREGRFTVRRCRGLDAERLPDRAEERDLRDLISGDEARGVQGDQHVAKLATTKNPRFTQETARATGRSERSVQRDTSRGEVLGELVAILGRKPEPTDGRACHR